MIRLGQTGQAIALMITAIFFFSAMDATAKELARHTGPVPAIWARYAGQATMVLILVAPRLNTIARTQYPWLQLARSIFLMFGTTFFFFGVANIGLAEATAIMDINPVLITLGAAIFLNEKIGLRRALGIAASLVGALIIIRPGMGVFQPAAIIPLISALMFALYGLLTRYAARRDSAATSFFWTGTVGMVAMTAVGAWFWEPMSGGDWAWMGLLCLTGAGGHYLLIKTYEVAEASVVQPFAYFQLVFAAAIGLLAVGEVVRLNVALGAAIVIAAGLFTLWRERRNR